MPVDGGHHTGNNAGVAIVVVDADPAWPGQFDALGTRLRRALAGVPIVAIEHVGSTAVPGLAAKPVIDIDIVVDAEQVEAASAALERIGYLPLGELGIPDRWAFEAPSRVPATHTYVTIDGCLALRNHLAVRDVLRADPILRNEYGALKRHLAATVDDMDSYVDGKSNHVQRILEAAELDEADRERIRSANHPGRI